MAGVRPRREASKNLHLILAQEKTECVNFDFPLGLKVFAAYVTSNKKSSDKLNYYNGVVVGHNNDGTYNITYDDGDTWDSVPQNYVELRQNSVPPGIK